MADEQWHKVDAEAGFPFFKIYAVGSNRDVATCWSETDADSIIVDHKARADCDATLAALREALELIADPDTTAARSITHQETADLRRIARAALAQAQEQQPKQEPVEG